MRDKGYGGVRWADLELMLHRFLFEEEEGEVDREMGKGKGLRVNRGE